MVHFITLKSMNYLHTSNLQNTSQGPKIQAIILIKSTRYNFCKNINCFD